MEIIRSAVCCGIVFGRMNMPGVGNPGRHYHPVRWLPQPSLETHHAKTGIGFENQSGIQVPVRLRRGRQDIVNGVHEVIGGGPRRGSGEIMELRQPVVRNLDGPHRGLIISSIVGSSGVRVSTGKSWNELEITSQSFGSFGLV